MLACTAGFSQNIPQAIHYQGQVKQGAIRYEGEALLRFALIDDSTPDPIILWSNDSTNVGETADNEPDSAVNLTVTKGLFNVALGDDSITNMTQIPMSVFSDHKIVRLRVWFQENATAAIDLMSPDTQLLAVPYAFKAGSADIPDGSITRDKLARESVSTEHRGRSNTIKSIYFDVETSNQPDMIYDVPDGKTFVITDIFLMSAQKDTIWTLTNDPTSTLEQYWKFALDARFENSLQNWSYSFQSGIRFVAPDVISWWPNDEISQTMRIRGTIHGFEFDTPQ